MRILFSKNKNIIFIIAQFKPKKKFFKYSTLNVNKTTPKIPQKTKNKNASVVQMLER